MLRLNAHWDRVLARSVRWRKFVVPTAGAVAVSAMETIVSLYWTSRRANFILRLRLIGPRGRRVQAQAGRGERFRHRNF